MTARGSVRPLLLCAVGALAVALLWIERPDAPGAARLSDPPIALAVFDTVWLLLVAWPGRVAGAASSPVPSSSVPWGLLVLLVIGAPFHMAVAGAASAGGGHLGAWALLLGAWALVAAVASGNRRYVACLGCAALVLPLAGYGMREFLGLSTLDAVLASPLTGPTLLARSAPTVTAGDALPGLLAAAVVLIACVAGRPAAEDAV